ncbi:hypothetical protein V2J09_016358 [Rumex salicifolius]
MLPLETNTQPLLCRVSVPKRIIDALDRLSESIELFNTTRSYVDPEYSHLFTSMELIRVHNPSVFALVETHISGYRADQVCKSIDFD